MMKAACASNGGKVAATRVATPSANADAYRRARRLLSLVLLLVSCLAARVDSVMAQAAPADDALQQAAPGELLFREYCRMQTIALRDACLVDVHTLDEWERRRPVHRQQLWSMLGLDPLPERTDLKATVTAAEEHRIEDAAAANAAIRVERIVFQSQPGLYVTGNLYLPVETKERRPAILYLCGHGAVRKNGVSYGNKVHYHHHGIWYARNGYVCLVIDSVQLGEIEGIHHGTYRYGMWWWLARGYTPAGVEAWNCLRALDYLESRPEVDARRLGVTGRSGGGAYSWWIAALDDRVQVAVPVAGITDLQNHVIDNCVDGHCDCMFCVNTYRWDYPLVAALVAPRPLLISNTDRDPIFPLEGVVRTHAKVRHIYELYGKPENLALHITAGPHEDTQELQIHAFRWFNQHLKREMEPVEIAARPWFQPGQLQVFATQSPPADARNARIHEEFVPRANPVLPNDRAAWERQRDSWRAVLDDQVFRGWPREVEPLDLVETHWRYTDSIVAGEVSFQSERPFRLPMVILGTSDLPRDAGVELRVVDHRGWSRWGQPVVEWLATEAEKRAAEGTRSGPESASGNVRASREGAVADEGDDALTALLAHVRTQRRWLVVLPPRGIGPTAMDPAGNDEASATRLQRRLYLLGQTLDGLRTWDVRRGMQVLRDWARTRERSLVLHGDASVAGPVLYATLYESGWQRLELEGLPASHQMSANPSATGREAASLSLEGAAPQPDPRSAGGLVFLNVMRYFDVPHVVAMAAERGPVILRVANPADHAWETARQWLRVAELPAERLSIEPADGDSRNDFAEPSRAAPAK